MLTKARSFLASHQDASKLVHQAEKFSIRVPVVGRVSVPPPDQIAFYGVLGVLVAGGLIDWPVALAMGVGQVVVARHFSDRTAPAAEPGTPPAREIKAAGPAQARKAAPRKAAPRKAAPRKAAPRKTAVRKATPGKATKPTET